jgi:hypothetical protein
MAAIIRPVTPDLVHGVRVGLLDVPKAPRATVLLAVFDHEDAAGVHLVRELSTDDARSHVHDGWPFMRGSNRLQAQ